VDAKSGVTRVVISERYYRPTEVDFLLGDYGKAKKVLGWEPEVHFDELVKEMVDADVELMRRNHNA